MNYCRFYEGKEKVSTYFFIFLPKFVCEFSFFHIFILFSTNKIAHFEKKSEKSLFHIFILLNIGKIFSKKMKKGTRESSDC